MRDLSCAKITCVYVCVWERDGVLQGYIMMERSLMCLYETLFISVSDVRERDWRQDGCGMPRAVIAGASPRMHFCSLCDVMITSVLSP